MDEALMGDYRECESRHDCNDVSEELAEAKKEIERLRAMIEDACKVFDHYDLPEHAFHYRRAIADEQLPHAAEG
jgi:hypothetical protein